MIWQDIRFTLPCIAKKKELQPRISKLVSSMYTYVYLFKNKTIYKYLKIDKKNVFKISTKSKIEIKTILI